jgi:hypothetical protein
MKQFYSWSPHIRFISVVVLLMNRYLEITYRRGRPVAAYLYLPRQEGDVSARTEQRGVGLVLDYTVDGRAIGVEITAPGAFTLAAINTALASVGQEPATPDEVAPLLVARQPPRTQQQS